ncbi:hypothetical protein Sliba_14160 [Streptomyces nigrescens]|uniref:Uncharacterized protein n=1 Tax=Streptomyces nigrescens TaxID=1920 RepID=A0A640TB50_STRNI|nr:hypothetical protein Sliba_14160 [Streptomyces libani subsp. libani]GGV88592.1 hypothetical protein GCM10010500_11560 [Streptomyces libani subsp. libani]
MFLVTGREVTVRHLMGVQAAEKVSADAGVRAATTPLAGGGPFHFPATPNAGHAPRGPGPAQEHPGPAASVRLSSHPDNCRCGMERCVGSPTTVTPLYTSRWRPRRAASPPPRPYFEVNLPISKAGVGWHE